MKIIAKTTLAILALGVLPASAQQSSDSASADASATIIAAISIAKDADLNFGQVVTGSVAGNVVLSAALTPTRTAPGGTGPTLGNSTGVTSAKFSVTGNSGSTYAITLPSSAAALTGPGTAMSVDTFASSAATGTVGDSFYVGGTLHVGAAQVAGTYTGTFDVSVAYN